MGRCSTGGSKSSAASHSFRCAADVRTARSHGPSGCTPFAKPADTHTCVWCKAQSKSLARHR
eukprot:5521410-Pyramimonas_sp.AAC.1